MLTAYLYSLFRHRPASIMRCSKDTHSRKRARARTHARSHASCVRSQKMHRTETDSPAAAAADGHAISPRAPRDSPGNYDRIMCALSCCWLAATCEHARWRQAVWEIDFRRLRIFLCSDLSILLESIIQQFQSIDTTTTTKKRPRSIRFKRDSAKVRASSAWHMCNGRPVACANKL